MINNLKEIGNMVVKLSYKTLLFFLCVMMVAALCFWAERQPRFSVTVNTAPKGTPVPHYHVSPYYGAGRGRRGLRHHPAGI